MDLYSTFPKISENNVTYSKKRYEYQTEIRQYDHPFETMQFVPNFIQVNRRDIRLPSTQLVDIDSELKNITRNLSKEPTTRYLGPNKCGKKYNDKNICICPSCLSSNVVNQNKKESSKKIINNHPTVTYTECNTRRTKSDNSQCNGKPEGVLNRIFKMFS